MRIATFLLSAVSKADIIFTCLDKIAVKYFTTISASQVFPFTFSFFGRGKIGRKLKNQLGDEGRCPLARHDESPMGGYVSQ